MKHGTKYRLKADAFDWPAGTIVYRLALCDYGVKNDDTRFTGIEHVSITQDPEGGYPFITTPIDNLEEIVEAPPAPAVLKPFDNYEISPCTRTEEPDKPGHFYFEVCEPHEADVWTLYGHIPGEGVMAIGDFATREGAEEAFQRITGIPFGSHDEVEAKVRLMHSAEDLLAALWAAMPFVEQWSEWVNACDDHEESDEIDRQYGRMQEIYAAATGFLPEQIRVALGVDQVVQADWFSLDEEDETRATPEFETVPDGFAPKVGEAWSELQVAQKRHVLKTHIKWTGFKSQQVERVIQNIIDGNPKAKWFEGVP